MTIMFSKYLETHLCWLSVVWVGVSLSYTLVERSINVSKLRQISKLQLSQHRSLTTTGPESKWITTQLSQPQTHTSTKKQLSPLGSGSLLHLPCASYLDCKTATGNPGGEVALFFLPTFFYLLKIKFNTIQSQLLNPRYPPLPSFLLTFLPSPLWTARHDWPALCLLCRETSASSWTAVWTSGATAARPVAAESATAAATTSPWAASTRGRTTTKAGGSSVRSSCHATGGSPACWAGSEQPHLSVELQMSPFGIYSTHKYIF